MPTFTLISAATVGSGGAASIDFTSIPSTYTDLVLISSLRRSDASNSASIEFNGSSANFTYRRLFGTGSGTGSDTVGSLISNLSTQTANTFSSNHMYIPNYTSTSTHKSFSIDAVNEDNATSASAWLIAGLWSPATSVAINQITLRTTLSATFVQHSTAYLYGVSNA